MKTSVAEETESSGIGRNISSNMARSLCSQVQWEQVVLLSQVLVSNLQDDTSVSHQHTRGLIEAADLVHARGVDDNLIKDRHRATD